MAEPRAKKPDDDGGETGRVRCLYCGANNYPSSATCWQCGRPLKQIRTQPSQAAGPVLPQATTAPMIPAPRAAVSTGMAETSLAPKTAAMLGLLFPYIGLPVGMVFLMLDDPRKTYLGWVTIGWSIAGTAISAILFLATLGPIMALLHSLIPSGGHSGGLPGLPLPGGGADGLNLLFRQLTPSRIS